MSGAWDGFTSTASVSWGLGNYDAPDLVFNGVDAFGVEWICKVPEGWNRTTTDVPLLEGAGDGGWFSPGRRKPRVMTLTGAFRCSSQSQMDAAEYRLRSAVEHYTEDQTIWHTALPTGAPAKQMAFRATGDVNVDYVDSNPRIRQFSAVLTAADPLKYAAGAMGLSVYTAALNSVTTGMKFPLQFPLNFGGGVLAGRIQAVNVGTQAVFPVVAYTGFVDSPQLRHLGLGVAEGIRTQLLGGQTCTVDHRYHSILLGAQSIYGQRITSNTFFPLLSGRNDLSFTANGYSAAASITLTYRPAWS